MAPCRIKMSQRTKQIKKKELKGGRRVIGIMGGVVENVRFRGSSQEWDSHCGRVS